MEHDLDKICASSGHGNNNWKVSLKSLENCRSCGDKTDRLLDGRKDGQMDEPITIVPLDLCWGTITEPAKG